MESEIELLCLTLQVIEQEVKYTSHKKLLTDILITIVLGIIAAETVSFSHFSD